MQHLSEKENQKEEQGDERLLFRLNNCVLRL